jgi:aminopeptidase N
MKVLSGIVFFALLLLHIPSYAVSETLMPLGDLTVRFDLHENRMTGVSNMTLPAGRPSKIHIRGIKVTSVSVNGRPLLFNESADSLTFTPGSPEDILKIEYEAEYPPGSGNGVNTRGTYCNFITPDAVLLTSNWYPAVEGISRYRLTAVLPSEIEGISGAEEVIVTDRTDNTREYLFVFDHPLRELSLAAGKYSVNHESYRDIEIYTYLLSSENGISSSYMEAVRQYLDRYTTYFGKYPYRRLAVAETSFPGRYSFPGMIIADLSSDRSGQRPSLGNLIVQQWFGNTVYVDVESGNWGEGLTAYLADHDNEALAGRGWNYRKNMLVLFQSYITEEKDLPLQSFTKLTGRNSAAIGSGKSAMVFHMLREMLGEEVFYASLRRLIENNSFRVASWKDLRQAFETGYGESLEWFFQQWTAETGIPDLEVKDLHLEYAGDKIILKFRLNQKEKLFRFYLPVTVKLRDGEIKKVFLIEKDPRTLIKMEVDGTKTPVSLVLDEDYDLFRKLSGEEFPPAVSRLLGDDKKIYVLSEGKEDIEGAFGRFLFSEGFVVKKEKEIMYDDLRTSSLLIPDRNTALVRRLFGKIDLESSDFSLIIKENPLNEKKVIAVMENAPTADPEHYLRRLGEFEEYGKISFSGDETGIKTGEGAGRGMESRFSQPVDGIATSRVKDLFEIIDRISEKDVVYVGESHDRFEDHRVQLQVIKELYKIHPNTAIGMEMFQKSSQQALDDYISGKTDERTFLKESDYFKQWGFDYKLYREILLFARAYKIPVIALNIRKDIVSKVAKEGLQSLADDELKEVPVYFDISDNEYKERLRDIFQAHGHTRNRNFDFFYQAQVLWDESMARNLDEFMRANPEHKVIVLAGQGHLMYGSGIPSRAFRLNGRSFGIILNSAEIEEGIADFVLFPPTVQLPESPRLGVVLKEENKKVIIAGISSGSVAEKAGLQENDVLVSVDDTKIENADDLRIFLTLKKKGDEIVLRALRKSLLFGYAEKVFKVML